MNKGNYNCMVRIHHWQLWHKSNYKRFSFPLMYYTSPMYIYQVWIAILLLQMLSGFRVSANCCTWIELLYAQEKKFDACTVYIEIMFKPCRVKFHDLFELLTYTGHQKGSSKIRCSLSIYLTFGHLTSYSGVDILDIHPLKVNPVYMKAQEQCFWLVRSTEYHMHWDKWLWNTGGCTQRKPCPGATSSITKSHMNCPDTVPRSPCSAATMKLRESLHVQTNSLPHLMQYT
jgi:hypothetical protein